jgi:hypothetical protein
MEERIGRRAERSPGATAAAARAAHDRVGAEAGGDCGKAAPGTRGFLDVAVRLPSGCPREAATALGRLGGRALELVLELLGRRHDDCVRERQARHGGVVERAPRVANRDDGGLCGREQVRRGRDRVLRGLGPVEAGDHTWARRRGHEAPIAAPSRHNAAASGAVRRGTSSSGHAEAWARPRETPPARELWSAP